MSDEVIEVSNEVTEVNPPKKTNWLIVGSITTVGIIIILAIIYLVMGNSSSTEIIDCGVFSDFDNTSSYECFARNLVNCKPVILTMDSPDISQKIEVVEMKDGKCKIRTTFLKDYNFSICFIEQGLSKECYASDEEHLSRLRLGIEQTGMSEEILMGVGYLLDGISDCEGALFDEQVNCTNALLTSFE